MKKPESNENNKNTGKQMQTVEALNCGQHRNVDTFNSKWQKIYGFMLTNYSEIQREREHWGTTVKAKSA